MSCLMAPGEFMMNCFESKYFLILLKALAAAPGPTLKEEPRRLVLESYFRNNGLVLDTDPSGNGFLQIGEGRWEDTVVFDAHLDVVQQGYTENIKIENDRVRGLGVADNLTAVALLSLFAVSLNKMRDRLNRPIHFLFSVGEEGLGNLKGIHQFVKDHEKPPYAFLSFDLSFEEYSIAALGSIRYEIAVECPGGHSWEAYGTPSAIEILLDFFSRMRAVFNRVSTGRNGELSFNIGMISGGEGVNSIARRADAVFEFRGTDRHDLIELGKRVKEITDSFNERERGVSMVCVEIGYRPASNPVNPERIEQAAVHALKSIGEDPVPVVRSTNINATLAAGWPSLCMGLCKSGRFHSDDEYVILDSVDKGWQVLCRLFEKLVQE